MLREYGSKSTKLQCTELTAGKRLPSPGCAAARGAAGALRDGASGWRQ
jgi:hypothetical protein